jgi:hypothetical protein
MLTLLEKRNEATICIEPCRFSRSGSKSETSTQQVLKVADAETLEDDRTV